MTRTPEQHSEDSRYAAHVMWAGTADRKERLRNAHTNSFGGEVWHARRLFGPDVDLDALSAEQWKQVEAARRSWTKAVSIKGNKAKRLKQAQRLRERAAAIEAEVAEAGDA